MDMLAHTRLPAPIFRGLKRVRDAAADALAAAAVRSPAVERAMVRSFRATHGRWLALELFRRRAVDAFLAAAEARGAEFKRVRVAGMDVWGQVTHFTFRAPYFDGVDYEERTTALLMESLPPGGTFVDVGANRGYFTLLAALRTGGAGRVFAFEPNPAVVAHLRQALQRNGIDGRVAIVQVALSDQEAGSVPFYVPRVEGNDGLSSLRPSTGELAAARDEQRIDVPTTTYDAWSAESGVGRADVVKIDVEGCEEGVIRGMERTLSTLPPRRIICETEAGSPGDLLLRAHGYACRPLDVSDAGFGNWLYTHPS